jgi:putative ABC transport system permease protein
MIVVQFALSIGFIMSVVIVIDQYRSALNHDFGFNQENILDVELQNVDPQLFENEMSKLSAVQSISMSSSVPGTSFAGSVWIHKEDATDSTEVDQLFIDENYISNLDLHLIAGRNFTGDEREDKEAVIVNEEFLRFRNLTPSDVLGETMIIRKEEKIRIVGVAKDFHYRPITDPIQSFFFRYDPGQFAYANLKVTSTDMKATLADLEAAWKPIGGELHFKSKFLTDEISEAYDFYFSMVQICGFLGGLAISISCLGLLGMVVYTAETRTKEVGVRKVMGASTFQLAVLLSKGYVKLMAIAALIAVPMTYFLIGAIIRQMRYYSEAIGVMEIVISLFVVLFLGLTTILSQTWKAARSNPVDTLRYE